MIETPFYEYKCENCGYKFEIFTGYSCEHDLEMDCPVCKERARYVFSTFNYIEPHALDIKTKNRFKSI